MCHKKIIYYISLTLSLSSFTAIGHDISECLANNLAELFSKVAEKKIDQNHCAIALNKGIVIGRRPMTQFGEGPTKPMGINSKSMPTTPEIIKGFDKSENIPAIESRGHIPLDQYNFGKLHFKIKKLEMKLKKKLDEGNLSPFEKEHIQKQIDGFQKKTATFSNENIDLMRKTPYGMVPSFKGNKVIIATGPAKNRVAHEIALSPKTMEKINQLKRKYFANEDDIKERFEQRAKELAEQDKKDEEKEEEVNNEEFMRNYHMKKNGYFNDVKEIIKQDVVHNSEAKRRGISYFSVVPFIGLNGQPIAADVDGHGVAFNVPPETPKPDNNIDYYLNERKDVAGDVITPKLNTKHIQKNGVINWGENPPSYLNISQFIYQENYKKRFGIKGFHASGMNSDASDKLREEFNENHMAMQTHIPDDKKGVGGLKHHSDETMANVNPPDLPEEALTYYVPTPDGKCMILDIDSEDKYKSFVKLVNSNPDWDYWVPLTYGTFNGKRVGEYNAEELKELGLENISQINMDEWRPQQMIDVDQDKESYFNEFKNLGLRDTISLP